jgi:LuxR family maltose regulon positive regulatory protein
MLVAAKLQGPSIRSALVDRPLMIRKLNEGLHAKLTIMVAPAGYGKTTALAQWAKQIGMPAAWISLDKKDNDSFRFWNHVTESIGRLHPNVKQAMHPILSEYASSSADTVIAALLEGLDGVTGELSILLDDYHVIESPVVHEMLTEFLSYLPDHVHLFIATRIELPLAVKRLQARGQVNKIIVQDFCFQQEEGIAFFRDCMGIPMSREDVSLLLGQTEGWISGLQLAGLSLKENGVNPDFIRKFNGNQRDIADYLLEEVFQHQTDKTRTFLLHTSFLSRMNSLLCEAVMGHTHAQAQLEWLERHQLFIVPLDEERGWYRYHHLFADFLRLRFRELDKQQWMQAHAKAADWFEANGFAEEAVDCLIEGGHYADAVKLIEKLLPALMKTQWTVLYGWFVVIPDDYISTNLMIDNFYMAILMIIGQWDLAETRAKRAELRLQQGDVAVQESDHRLAAGNLHLLQAMMAVYRKDIVRSSDYFDKFDRHLPEGSFFQQLNGNSAQGTQLGDMLAYMNELRPAEHYLKLWVNRWENKRNYPFVGHFAASYSELMYEWNRLEEAERYAISVLNREDVQPFAQIVVKASLIASRVLHAKGDDQGAIELLERAKSRIATPDYQLFVRRIDGRLACQLFQYDCGQLAAQWLQTCGLAYNDVIPQTKFAEYYQLAEVLGKLGQLSEAVHVLERLYQMVITADCLRDKIRVLVLKGLLLNKLGSQEVALMELEHALYLGESEKYCRSFIDHGKPMAELLLDYVQRRRSGFIRPSDNTVSLLYVKKLLQAMNASLPDLPTLPPLLTTQETRIVGLIEKGLSNKEIAEQLQTAITTVHSHIRNIYRKLEASSRLQALQRAKDLNLL